jgi:hypothetical protein
LPRDAGQKRNAPDRIRTCDLRFRRPTLYPAELRAPTGDARSDDRSEGAAGVKARRPSAGYSDEPKTPTSEMSVLSSNIVIVATGPRRARRPNRRLGEIDDGAGGTSSGGGHAGLRS